MERPFFLNSRSKSLFLSFHLIGAILLLSLWIPITRDFFWNQIDRATFYFLNSSIEGHPLLQIFWALANIKITDLYGACFFVSSFLLYIFEAEDKETRRLRCGYLIFTLLWFEVSILFTKQLLTPICEYYKIARHSPTVVLPDTIRLSLFTPWAKIKDVSHFCFPSDHAVIMLQWSMFFTFFAGWKRGLVVSLFSIVFILPRLISGAHWISDILVGSLSIVLIVFAWATQSRIYPVMMGWIQSKIMRLKEWNVVAQRDQNG